MKLQKQNTLFNYINESKSNNQTIERVQIKLYILSLIIVFFSLYLVNGFEFNQKLFLFSIGNITLIFVLVYLYQKFYLKYDSKTLFAPVPETIGNILVKFSANNLQVLSKNKKREINGLLIIGDKSIAFVPYKYSFMNLKTVQIPWQEITTIYKSSGLLIDNWMMKFEFYKRYIHKNASKIVIETGAESYYFQALSADQIVDDLNELKESCNA